MVGNVAVAWRTDAARHGFVARKTAAGAERRVLQDSTAAAAGAATGGAASGGGGVPGRFLMIRNRGRRR